MVNHINSLEILNFKSIKKIQLSPKRINLIIGKPNVGKSNILEALSLFGAPYATFNPAYLNKYLSEFIRYEDFDNLFYDQNTENSVEVKTNLGTALIKSFFARRSYLLCLSDDSEVLKKVKTERHKEDALALFADNLNNFAPKKSSIGPYVVDIPENTTNTNIKDPNFFRSPFKKFSFSTNSKSTSREYNHLKPPFGDNLYSVLFQNKRLYKEISSYFKEYKLDLVFKPKEKTLELQKKEKGIVFSYPYSTVADTLQRLIFYTLVCETNKDSIILLEEPEAHSFPPYIRQIAEKIIESESNQFFITTHSPFILNTIIENAPLDSIAVFHANYERHQTVVKQLSTKELKDLLDYGNDLFFKLDN